MLFNKIRINIRIYTCNHVSSCNAEGDDCEIQFGESVLLPAAEAYRRDHPDYDPTYDDLDSHLQFFIALDVSKKEQKKLALGFMFDQVFFNLL